MRFSCRLTLGEDGATHQILEDLGMMKMMPEMTVINPTTITRLRLLPLPLRITKDPCTCGLAVRSFRYMPADEPFIIGKALMLNKGADVSIFATGHLVWKAIEAGEILAEKGIDAEIINIHTIKPLDTEAILQSVKKTGCAVSAEEHQLNGGLGDSVAQVLCRNYPAPWKWWV